jgi:hypothetical protein
MFGAILISTLGLFSIFLAKILAWPVWLVLVYVLGTIDFFAQIPLAYFRFQNVSWVFIALYYFVFFTFIFWQKKKEYN